MNSKGSKESRETVIKILLLLKFFSFTRTQRYHTFQILILRVKNYSLLPPPHKFTEIFWRRDKVVHARCTWTLCLHLKYLILVPDIQEAKCSEFAVQTLPLPLEAPSGGGMYRLWSCKELQLQSNVNLQFTFCSPPLDLFLCIRPCSPWSWQSNNLMTNF